MAKKKSKASDPLDARMADLLNQAEPAKIEAASIKQDGPLLTPEATAEQLLVPLWRGIAKAYKMRYARTIWQQFEDGIKSAASTSDVGQFVNNFCARMQCDLLTEDVAKVAHFLQAADGRKLLKSLREETTYLVLLVRVANEARKEEWKKEQEEKNGDL